ncbi:MAG: hypothetical protein JWM40_1263 [Frankiales bacterium]|nr:hypothetical protein [Frankiales bacterium]
MRRIAVLIAATLAVGLCPSVVSAASAPRYRVWELTRINSDPTNIAVGLTGAYDQSRVLLAVGLLRSTGSASRGLGSFLISDEGKTDGQGFVGGRVVACTLSACRTELTHGYDLMTIYYHDAGGASADHANRIVAVGYGRSPTLELDGKGWRVREVRRVVHAVWSTSGEGSTGFSQQQLGAEVFQRSSANGGPRGSVAMAVPPCAGVVSVGGGAGKSTLSGGPEPVSVTCPVNVAGVSQAASRRTAWVFAGLVAGLTAYVSPGPGPVRLLVIDN